MKHKFTQRMWVRGRILEILTCAAIWLPPLKGVHLTQVPVGILSSSGTCEGLGGGAVGCSPNQILGIGGPRYQGVPTLFGCPGLILKQHEGLSDFKETRMGLFT